MRIKCNRLDGKWTCSPIYQNTLPLHTRAQLLFALSSVRFISSCVCFSFGRNFIPFLLLFLLWNSHDTSGHFRNVLVAHTHTHNYDLIDGNNFVTQLNIHSDVLRGFWSPLSPILVFAYNSLYSRTRFELFSVRRVLGECWLIFLPLDTFCLNELSFSISNRIEIPQSRPMTGLFTSKVYFRMIDNFHPTWCFHQVHTTQNKSNWTDTRFAKYIWLGWEFLEFWREFFSKMKSGIQLILRRSWHF